MRHRTETGLDTKMGCVGHLWRASLSVVKESTACLWPQGPKAVHFRSCSSKDLRTLTKKKIECSLF